MIAWLLTIYLAGVPIFTDPFPYQTETECKQEAYRLILWYQQDHLHVRYACESS